MRGEPLSVVVPVYRNAETLAELHRRLVGALSPRTDDLQLVFVDDASPDASREVLTRLGAQDARVELVALDANVGQQRAVLEGLRRTTGRRVVVLDADLQDPPEAVPALLDLLDGGSSAAFALRRGDYEPAGRLLTSRIFKAILSVITGVPRGSAMFVAFDAAVRERVLAMRTDPPYLVAMIGAAGLPVSGVPVSRSPRPVGRSAFGRLDRLRAGVDGLRAAVQLRRRGQEG